MRHRGLLRTEVATGNPVEDVFPAPWSRSIHHARAWSKPAQAGAQIGRDPGRKTACRITPGQKSNLATLWKDDSVTRLYLSVPDPREHQNNTGEEHGRWRHPHCQSSRQSWLEGRCRRRGTLSRGW